MQKVLREIHNLINDLPMTDRGDWHNAIERVDMAETALQEELTASEKELFERWKKEHEHLTGIEVEQTFLSTLALGITLGRLS